MTPNIALLQLIYTRRRARNKERRKGKEKGNGRKKLELDLWMPGRCVVNVNWRECGGKECLWGR